MDPFYEEDLAYVHHAGFTEFADKAGDELLRIFHDAGIRDGPVIDLGCGTGVWAAKLIAHGYRVLGIDLSPAMIEIARRTAPGAEFRVASIHHGELPACSAVTALGEVLNYRAAPPGLFCSGRSSHADEGHRPGSRTHGLESHAGPSLDALFRRVAESLEEGGIFAFDVIVRGEEPMRYRSWSKGTDWAVLVEVCEESAAGELVRDITVFRRTAAPSGPGRPPTDPGRSPSDPLPSPDAAALFRRSEERHRVQVLDASEIEASLRRAGFEPSVSGFYGAYPLAPRRVAFLARRKGAPSGART